MTIKACFSIYTCICIERIERTFFYFQLERQTEISAHFCTKTSEEPEFGHPSEQQSSISMERSGK